MLPFPLLSCYIPCLQQLPTSLSVIIPVYEPPFFLLAVAYMFPRGLFSQHTLWMHSEMQVSVPAWCSGTLHLPQPLHPGSMGPCLFCSFRTWDDAFLHPSPTASLRPASLARARLLFARLFFPWSLCALGVVCQRCRYLWLSVRPRLITARRADITSCLTTAGLPKDKGWALSLASCPSMTDQNPTSSSGLSGDALNPDRGELPGSCFLMVLAPACSVPIAEDPWLQTELLSSLSLPSFLQP